MEFTNQMTVRAIQQVGGDAMVVAAAKVSVDSDEALQWALEEYDGDARGLIRYLMKHRHGSPFEHGMLTVFADVPIFVWREWQRHRVWSYNEQSARYSQLRPKFWVPAVDRPMKKVDNYKAARPKFEVLSPEVHRTYANDMRRVYEFAWKTYDTMIQEDAAPEVARAVLPVGIYSTGWASVNPRGIMQFLSLRTHEPGALYVSYPQYEIEEAARQIEEVFKEYWPVTYEEFVARGRMAP